MTQVCYTLNFPRPIGVEPTVYLKRPNITPTIVKNPEWSGIDPYSDPEIIEHATVMGALKYIIDFNWNCQYLKELKIKDNNNE